MEDSEKLKKMDESVGARDELFGKGERESVKNQPR